MAKYFNNRIKTGKVAGSIFAVRYGEVIERAWQPVVANPNTDAQVGVRAKMKALSQLGAVLAEVIAIPRNGAVSPRNQFIKKNYPVATYEGGVADITLGSVSLTNGVVGLPAISATRNGGAISVALATPESTMSRVVYVAVSQGADNKLRVVGSTVVSVSGDGTFAGSISTEALPAETGFIYAYGIRDNTDRARAVFGELESEIASAVASIIVTRVVTLTDITLTETRSVAFQAWGN